MKRFKKGIVFLAVTSLFVWTNISCVIGLGEAVDTEDPKVEITYPPKNSIIRDTFVISGTSSDDTEIKEIEIVLTKADDRNVSFRFLKSAGEVELADVTPKGEANRSYQWQANICKKDDSRRSASGSILYNGWDIPDGDYNIDVIATDLWDKSVPDRRTITIDNTAPVFIMENLSTLGSETNPDSLSTFGQRFNITGKAKDDHEIQSLSFTVYDENRKSLGESSVRYDMTTDGVKVARYFADEPEAEADKLLASNFRLIYGLPAGQKLSDGAEIRERYISVQLWDNALEYKEPVFDPKAVVEGKGKGNGSKEAYINTQAFGLQNITVDELNEYKKQIDPDAALGEKLKDLDVSSRAVVADGEKWDNVSKFRINPEVNPKWYVTNYDVTETGEFNQAFVGSPITMMFTKGNDEVKFRPNNIRVVLAKLKMSATGKYDTLTATEEALKTQKVSTEDVIILRDFGEMSSDLTLNHTETIKLDNALIRTPNRYRLMVFGHDGTGETGAEFVENNKSMYGIKAVRNAAPPAISFLYRTDSKLPKEESWLGPVTVDLPFDFTVKTDGEEMADGYPKVSISVTNNNGEPVITETFDGKNNDPAAKMDGTFELVKGQDTVLRELDGYTFTYHWKLTNKAGGKLPMPKVSGRYKYVISIDAMDAVEGSSISTIKFQVDKQEPTVSVKDAVPVVSGKYINGKISIPLSWDDNESMHEKEPARYEVKIGNNVVESGNVADLMDGKGNFVFDTLKKNDRNEAKYPDGTDIVITFTFKDHVGNPTVRSTPTYTVDQTTDKPGIVFTNLYTNAELAATGKKNSFGLEAGNLINGSVTDDDGVGEVYVRIASESDDINDSAWKLISKGESLISFVFYENGKNPAQDGRITSDGKYKLQFMAKDTAQEATGSNSIVKPSADEVYGILVDGKAPQFTNITGVTPAKDQLVEVGDSNGYAEKAKDGNYYYLPNGKHAKITVEVDEGNLEGIYVNKSATKLPAAQVVRVPGTEHYKVTYEWEPAQTEASGIKEISIVAKDESGNSKEKVVSLFYDAAAPVEEANTFEVLPSAGKTGANNNIDIVNGKIKVSGRITDADDRIDSIILNTKQSGTVKETKTWVDKINKTKEDPNYIDNGNKYTWEIDTNKIDANNAKIYADETDLVYEIVVQDRAGNKETYTHTMYINQATDKPEISPTNFVKVTGIDDTACFDDVGTRRVNMFTKSSILSGNISDDDGNCDVTITITKRDGTPVYKEDGVTPVKYEKSGVTSFACNLDSDLKVPGDGDYKVTITVKDSKNETANATTTEDFYIIVHGDAPILSGFKVKGLKSDNTEEALTFEGNVYYTNKPVTVTFNIFERYLDTNAVNSLELEADNGTVTNVSITAVDGQLNNYTGKFQWKPINADNTNVAAGKPVQLKIRAKDTVPNTSETSYVSLFYDNAGPQIEDPVVSSFVETSDSSINVNGTIKIKGSVSDNEDKVASTVIYIKDSNGTVVATQEVGKTSTAPFTAVGTSTATNYTYNLDTNTTELKDGKTYTIEVTSTDRTGNPSTNPNVKFKVNQATDKPKIEPVGFATLTNASAVDKNNNLYTAGSTIKATITDDDGIASVIVSYKKDSDTDWTTGTNLIPSGTTPVSYSLNYTLPAVDGKYQIKIDVKDKYVTNSMPNGESGFANSSYKTWLGVTSGDPTITLARTDSSYAGATAYYKPSESVSVTATVTGYDTSIKRDGTTVTAADTISLIGKADGYYTSTYTVTDAFGQTASATVGYYVDNTAPELEVTDPIANAWYNNKGNLTVSGRVSDDGAGVDKVYVALVGGDGTAPAESSTAWEEVTPNGGRWSKTVITEAEGKPAYTIYVKATDKMGNVQTNPAIPINVDTTAPETTVTFKKTGTTGSTFKGSNVLTNSGSFTVSGEASDNLGQATVTVSNSGTNTITQTGKEWSMTKSSLASGDYSYTFTVTDQAGNKTEYVKTITVDTENPTISNISVTPKSGDYVNGKVKISLTVADNKELVSPLNYEYVDKNGDKQTLKKEWTETVSFRSINDIEIDTKTLKDKVDTVFTFTVKDKAGNEGTGTFTLKVDQSTDTPDIVPTNAEKVTSADGLNVSNDYPDGKNIFGIASNNKFKATITDDDGIASVIVSYKKDGDANWTEGTNLITSGTPVSYNLDYKLPVEKGEGKYQIKIDVKDKYATDSEGKGESGVATSSYETWFGLSEGTPTISVSTRGLKYVTSKDGSATNVPITGTFTGGSSTVITRTYKVGNGAATTPEPITPTGKTWSDSVPATAAADTNAKVVVTYNATNLFGQSAVASTYSYMIDNVAPVIEKTTGDNPTDTISIRGKAYKPYGWANENKFLITAKWNESGYGTTDVDGYHGGSGIAKVDYWLNYEEEEFDGSDTPTGTFVDGSYNGDWWTLSKNIADFPEGSNWLHFQATDEAGNKSAISHFKVSVDTTMPEVIVDTVEFRKKGTDSIVLTGTVKDTTVSGDTEKASGLNTWAALRVFKGDVPVYNEWQNGDTKEEQVTTPTNQLAVIYALNGKTDTDNGATGAVNFDYNYVNSAKFKVTIPASDLGADGEYTLNLVGLDVAENRSKATSVKVYLDSKAPDIDDPTVSPMITVGGRSDNVNGVIKIRGTAEDTDKVALTTIEILKADGNRLGNIQTVGQTVVSPFTAVEGVTNSNTNFSYNVNTKTLANGEYTIKVTAQDRTGNSASNNNVKFNVNQESDRPVITPSGFTKITTADGVDKDHNFYGTAAHGNNVLHATITDDDGIASVIVSYKKEGAASWTNGTNLIPNGTAPLSYNLDYTLPDSDGKYEIKIEVADKLNATDYSTLTYNTWVAVSSGASTITLTRTDSAHTGATDFYKPSESVSVTATVTGYDTIIKRDGTTVTAADTISLTGKDDGYYTNTYTVTDAFGQTASATVGYYVDQTSPELEVTDPAADTWYDNKGTVTVTGKVSDNGAGVDKVYVALVAGNGTAPAESSTDWTEATLNGGRWSKAVTTSAEGKPAYTIYVKATDMMGNVQTKDAIPINVDTTAPSSTMTFTKTGSTGSAFGASNVLTNSGDFMVSGTVSDNLGQAVITVSDSANNVISTTGNNWSMTKSGLAAGDYSYTFTVTDQAGNKTEYVKTITVDTQAPTITNMAVTPKVGDTVNGKVVLSLTMADNKELVSPLTYKYVDKNGDEQTLKKEWTEAVSFRSINDIEIDTTTLKDNADTVFTFSVKDKAGNEGTETFTLKVDQSKDTPEVVLSNAEKVTTAVGLNVSDANPAGKNIFGTTSNNVLKATITDDDGIASVIVSYKKAGDADWTNGTNLITSGTPVSYSLNYTLPSAEGKYQIKIAVEDSLDETGELSKASYETWVGVSAGSPTISVTTPAGQFKKGSTNDKAESFAIAGIWTGESGTTITREVSGATQKTDSDGNIVDADPAKAADNTFTDSITAYATGNVTVTVTYTATDMFNQKGTASYSYKLDNELPTFAAGSVTTTTSPALSADSKNWYNTNAVAYKVVAADGKTGDSGVSTIQYTTSANPSADSDWTDMIPTENAGEYTGTIIFPSQGANTVKFRAKDRAGNVSTESNNATSKVYIDTKAPDGVSLKTVDGVSFTGRKLANGENDVVVVATVKDYTAISGANAGTDASGIKTVTLIYDGEVQTGVTGTAAGDDYTFSVSDTLIKTSGEAGKTLVQIGVRVEDNVGNSYDVNLFALNIDSTPPADIKISELMDADSDTDGYTVNKTFKISGTASDDQALEKVELQYMIKGGSGYADATEDSNWTTYSFGDPATTVLGAYTWSASIDSTAGTFNGKTFKVRLKATDSAGNVSYGPLKADSAGKKPGEAGYTTTYDYPEIIVIQASDIPVITLDEMKVSGSTIRQSKITGSIEDDDGAIDFSKFKVSTDGTNWATTGLTKLGSSRWSYDFGNTDGAKTLYFQVEDKEGLTFNQNNNKDSQKLLIKGDENTSGNSISVTVDTKDPEVSAKMYRVSDDTEINTSNLQISGVVEQKVKLVVMVNDENAITEVGIQLDSATPNKRTSSIVKGGSGNEFEIDLPTSETLNGSTDTILRYYAIDAASRETSHTITMKIDNKKPEFEVKLPSSTTPIAGETTVNGLANDGDGGSGVKEIRWFIPTNAEKTAFASAPEKTVYYTATDQEVIDGTNIEGDVKTLGKDDYFAGDSKKLEGTISWEIPFVEGGVNGRLQDYFYFNETNSTWYNFPASEKNNSTKKTYGTRVTGATLWDVPVYFRIEDRVGNVKYHTSYSVRVNPDGDRPIAQISYPTYNAASATGIQTLAGAVRISGEASDEVNEVTKVHIQVQKSKTNENSTTESDWEDVTGYSDVVVTGTYKWSYTLPTSNTEFQPSSGTKACLRFRVWAEDSSVPVKTGDKSAWVVIKTDKDNPLIGTTTPLRIVKYTDDDPTKSQLSSLPYEEGMYVSGVVFLEFSAEDASGIKTLEITEKKNAGTAIGDLVTGTHGATGLTIGGTAYTGYKTARVKIDTANAGATSGRNMTFNIVAEENKSEQPLSTTTPITLHWDNQAPVPGNITHGNTALGTAANTTTIKQDDGLFAIKSVIDENESGLAQMFVYFKRNDGTNQWRVFDPRGIKGSNAYYNYAASGRNIVQTITGTVDGLPYRRYENMTITGGNQFTLTTADPFLTRGTYALIDGTYRKISGVSGTTYTFDPPTRSTSANVDAIYAFALDNQNTEKQDLSSGDDGDGIWESVVDVGAQYECEMTFDSQMIPDGKLDVCSVVIDNAGNKSSLKTASTKVENSAPRLTKVFLGTDLNQNNTYDSNEYVEYGVGQKTHGGGYQYVNPKELVAGNEVPAGGFKIKKGLSVVAEFVGGEGNLAMVMKVGATDTTAQTGSGASLIAPEANLGDASCISYFNGKKSIDVNMAALAGTSMKRFLVANGSFEGDGTKNISFTFWDSAEGLIQGTDSQSAVLLVKDIIVDETDDVKPNVVINKFKWISKDDNSLYGNSPNNGHIELEDDLAGGTWDDYTDGAPKVSGQIVFRGTAYDDVCLKDLTFSFGSISGVLATYTAGTGWGNINSNLKIYTEKDFDTSDANYTKAKADAILKAFAQTASDEVVASDLVYLDQRGHKVAWELTVDTETVTSVGLNQSFTGSATDQSSNTSTDRTASETAGDGTMHRPTYAMDVVPYITKVKTYFTGKDKSIRGAYSRTSTGKYSVRSNETEIRLYGFNFGSGATVKDSETTPNSATVGTKASDANGTYLPLTSISSLRSGNVTVTVNTVKSINNINNDNACGDYKTVDEDGTVISDISGDSTYNEMVTYAYNRCPNNISNNMLTDDVYFDIWELNNRAATSRGAMKDPVMHINQASTDKEIGFGFVNAADGVSFPASGNSYVWFQKNRKDYKGTNFVFDNNGVAHNISIGLDAQASSGIAGRMNYNNSNWYSTNSYGSDVGNGGEGTIKQWDLRYNVALETIGIPAGVNLKGTTLGANIIDTDRFTTPAIAVSTHGNNKIPTVYIMYYDTDHDQIRFRYGDINNTNTRNSSRQNGNNRTGTANADYHDLDTFNYYSYGLLNDSKAERNSDNNTTITSDTRQQNDTWSYHHMFEASKDYYALVAGRYYKQANNNKDAFDTGNKGSAYYGLDVVPGTAIGDDKVVMIWFDEDAGSLMYMYRENLTAAGDNTDASSNGVQGKWSKPVALVEDTLLQDCVIKVDSKGGIHIAYYDQNNADLIYGYMSAYNKASEFTTCVVDAYSQVGNRVSIDTAVHATNGKVVPYISYFSDGLSSLPKMAYLPNGVSSADDVVDGADPETTLFTGNWEVTLIPTTSVLQPYNVGIGVWKDNSGKAIKQTAKTDVAYSTTNYNQKCYANGTSELVVGYSIKQSGIGYMETAMKR